jgi:hypothetical protein
LFLCSSRHSWGDQDAEDFRNPEKWFRLVPDDVKTAFNLLTPEARADTTTSVLYSQIDRIIKTVNVGVCYIVTQIDCSP